MHVEMKRHTFGCGTAVPASWINNNSSNGMIYKQKLLENFNHVVFENDLKWPHWIGGSVGRRPNRHSTGWMPIDFPRAAITCPGPLETAVPTTTVEITTTARWSPAVRSHQRQDADRQRRVFEWDVINHPVGWNGQRTKMTPT